MIGNYSEDDESVSLLITLSKGDCPALAGTPAASGRAEGDWPALERALRR